MNFGNNKSTFILGYIVIYYLSSYIISNRYTIFQCVLYCIIYLFTKYFSIPLSHLIILLLYPLYMIYINAMCILSYVGHGNVITYGGYVSNNIITISSIIDSTIFVYHFSITPSLFPESVIRLRKHTLFIFIHESKLSFATTL